MSDELNKSEEVEAAADDALGAVDGALPEEALSGDGGAEEEVVENQIAEEEAVDDLDQEDQIEAALEGEELAAREELAASEEDDAGGEEGEADVEEVGEEADVEEDVEEEEDEDAIKMDWYILKVQSNRERSITAALRRKVAIEGLDEYFGDVIVPTEKVTEFKNGKKKIVERKLYPGYIVVHMHINDDTWFAVRETSGIGDFTGSGGKPTPMLKSEVERIIHTDEEESDEAPKLNIKFKLEEAVKVKEGTFEGFEGNVSEIDDQSGKVIVMINIFGRSTPVELEYWQIEST